MSSVEQLIPHAQFDQLREAREILKLESNALSEVARRLDSGFCEAVDSLLTCSGSVIVCGMGKAGLIGQKLTATLSSTGTRAHFLHPAEAVHGDLGCIHPQDILLALSNSGETEEISALLPTVKRMGVPIIAITGSERSPLGQHADIRILLGRLQEACPWGLAPTTSTTAMLVMGDALAMAVLQARGFKEQDFARHHPAGAIGRSLLLQVRDIMRKDSRNAVAQEALTVKEALLVMTHAKSGSVSVVNARGKLVGVFTDGDLRRHMATDEKILMRSLSSVMTRDPICLKDDALAMEALKIFNERNIDDLIVVNAKKEPVGLVDSQDLPKLKIM